VPTAAHVDGQRLTLTVTLRHPGAGPITADMSPYVTVIETPPGLNPRARTVVHLHGQDYDLPPAVEDERL
jgi:hypothetical protein